MHKVILLLKIFTVIWNPIESCRRKYRSVVVFRALRTSRIDILTRTRLETHKKPKVSSCDAISRSASEIGAQIRNKTIRPLKNKVKAPIFFIVFKKQMVSKCLWSYVMYYVIKCNLNKLAFSKKRTEVSLICSGPII